MPVNIHTRRHNETGWTTTTSGSVCDTSEEALRPGTNPRTGCVTEVRDNCEHRAYKQLSAQLGMLPLPKSCIGYPPAMSHRTHETVPTGRSFDANRRGD